MTASINQGLIAARADFRRKKADIMATVSSGGRLAIIEAYCSGGQVMILLTTLCTGDQRWYRQVAGQTVQQRYSAFIRWAKTGKLSRRDIVPYPEALDGAE